MTQQTTKLGSHFGSYNEKPVIQIAIHIKCNISASRISTWKSDMFTYKPLGGRLSMGVQIDLVMGPPWKVTLPILVRPNVNLLLYFKILGNMMRNTFVFLFTSFISIFHNQHLIPQWGLMFNRPNVQPFFTLLQWSIYIAFVGSILLWS